MNKNNLIYIYRHDQDNMTILGCTPCKFCQIKMTEKDKDNGVVIMVCSCAEKCISLNKFEKMQ